MSGGVHLSFELQPKPAKRKTEIWTVVGQTDYRLGEVRWWPAWRRYTFLPDTETVYDASCLTTIANFCEHETQKRRAARKLERSKT